MTNWASDMMQRIDNDRFFSHKRLSVNQQIRLLAAARAAVADWDRWAEEPWNPDEPHWTNFAVTLDALRAAVEAVED